VRRWLVVLAACGGDATHHVDVSCANAIVYLDRFGGAYDHSAADDATQNVGIVFDGPRTLAPYPGDDVAWSDMSSCMRDALAQFDVVVTENDPGATPHLELVFTDTYWVDPAVTHVFPSSCKPGHQIEVIFGSALATPTRGCEVAMDGLAEMVGQLGPSQNCLDFTSPANDCGVRSFLAVDETCVDAQTDLAAPCRCDASATTQNSSATLAALLHACP